MASRTDSIATLPRHAELTVHVDCAGRLGPAALAAEDGHDPDFAARWMCSSPERFPANLSFVSIHRQAS
jgi:hypothetical protein